MDAPTAIAIATVAGVGLTLIVLLVRGTFMLGSLSNNVNNLNVRFDGLDKRVDGVDAKIDALADKVDAKFDAMDRKFDAKIDALADRVDAKFDRMADDMAALRAEIQQSNRTLAALANHGHDADGRIVFTIPQ